MRVTIFLVSFILIVTSSFAEFNPNDVEKNWANKCDQGDKISCRFLADAYLFGDNNLKIKRNNIKAFKYNNMLCQSETDVNFCYNLGMIYHEGIGVKQDYGVYKYFSVK